MIDYSLNYGLDLLKKYFEKSLPYNNVLDIGTGQGIDLFISKDVNPDCSLYGLEYYPPNVLFFKSIGINVNSIDLEKYSFPFCDEYFDIIINNQILEHTKKLFWIFYSPYGCSKGPADQYVRDYSRIYGYRQFGIEDQSWVAWFTIASLFDQQITIYGDGKQVRDVFFIDDLINAFAIAVNNPLTFDDVFNIGGGPKLQLSLLEIIDLLETNYNKKLNTTCADWRPGEQPVFVCDISKAETEFGWNPKIDVENGVNKLATWVANNKSLFKNYFQFA